ncbi:MAG TPA: peroxidase family protein, partial [Vicinamibacteria bacterium]|nr:peroxidase family protein [Vicinamibacteria bacterium]
MTASCRGGERALSTRGLPWVDWPSYWGAGDARSRGRAGTTQTRRGVAGALLDLEYQRIELIALNLFDTATYEAYVRGRGGLAGPSLRDWPEMRLPSGHPSYEAVGGRGPQLCRGELVRHRTVTGICNDLRNPAMGSTGQPFGRIVPFEATFPAVGVDVRARNRHGGRLALLTPDPQVIGRKLFTRRQAHPERCRSGLGLGADSAASECDYEKASTFNALGAFWIQFMTHDWFSHLEEGRNGPLLTETGCRSGRVDGVVAPLAPGDVAALGCRPGDRVDRAILAGDGPPPTFEHAGRRWLSRPPWTTPNTVTAWWDASQIYGYDEASRRRVKRDPADPARLLLVPSEGEPAGLLPLLAPGDPTNPAWAGQEATAFPDNWSVGLSFFHTVFAREHDAFVDAFRRLAALTPAADCGLRDPARPGRVIRYADVTPDELFEAARLVVAAEIAKIHTIEWTTQLLYDEPMYLALNANWSGLLGGGHEEISLALRQVVTALNSSPDVARAHGLYSALAAGPGIVGLGSHVSEGGALLSTLAPGRRDAWDVGNADHVNGGTNHFGSPFNFPEEFVTVYRLHSLVPDLLEIRDLGSNPDVVRRKVPVAETLRGRATTRLRSVGLANWALSLGRQRA